jgi:hypothetical protein
MKKWFYPLALLILILATMPIKVQADELSVVINEIAWMGTENSGNDEWLELFNTTEMKSNLNGWKLEAADGSPSINLEGSIGAIDYWLLERLMMTSIRKSMLIKFIAVFTVGQRRMAETI